MQQLKEFFEQGGFFMYVNLLCSVLAITLIVDRALFFLGKGAVNARAFLEQIRKLVTAGQLERAQRLCQGTDAPVALVARAGLSRIPKGEAAVSTAIEEALTDAAGAFAQEILRILGSSTLSELTQLAGRAAEGTVAYRRGPGRPPKMERLRPGRVPTKKPSPRTSALRRMAGTKPVPCPMQGCQNPGIRSKMNFCTAFQPGPPNSFGQPQPSQPCWPSGAS